MESVFPEPQSSKWESGKGTDAGESASSHVHHTLSFHTANDRKKRDYGKYDFESKNICTSGTHTAHRVRREYLRLRYLCSHDRVKKQREEWRVNYFNQANHFFFSSEGHPEEFIQLKNMCPELHLSRTSRNSQTWQLTVSTILT